MGDAYGGYQLGGGAGPGASPDTAAGTGTGGTAGPADRGGGPTGAGRGAVQADPVPLPSRASRQRSAELPAAGPGPVRNRRRRPVVVGIGGTTRAASTTHRALASVLATMGQAGAETVLLGSAELDLPMYAPERPDRGAAARHLLASVERADAVVIATPGYHGGISGLVKNALDHLEDLRDAPRPYLDGRAVGIIVCASGAQSAGTALTSLRSTVHALRGWPTPIGVTLDSTRPLFDPHGRVLDPEAARRLDILADQIMGFTYAWSQVI